MAYNPFNIFRRNQKALFAVLTVFVMVVFTLSSGVAGGDFFETFSRWLGAKSGSREALCKIDGRKVTVGELEGSQRSLQYRRAIANRFMFYAAQQTIRALEDSASQQRGSLSESGKQMADAAGSALRMMNSLNNPQFASNPQIFQILMQQIQPQIQKVQRDISDTLESPLAKSEDKDVARAYKTVFLLRQYTEGSQGEHYFLNAPNRTLRDLIEFKLWELKADQLGIRFSRADVKKLIQSDFYNYFRNDVEVRKMFAQTPGFTMEVCLDALSAEFRVRAAQVAVLGQSARYHRAFALPTPFETFEYFREQTSPATYEVLSVPAIGFVDKVSGEPSEAEINELFKKYADAEPNPRSETPGFKEPRKITVAWLGIQGDEPYYKNLAAEQIKVGEVMAKASGALTVPLPGAVWEWGAGAVAPLSLKEPAVDAAYARRTEAFRTEMRLKYERASFPTSDLLETSTVKAGVVAAAVGGFAGNPMAGVANALCAPIIYEKRDRTKVGLPLVLGAIPGPALLETMVGGVAAARVQEPKPLSIEALRPELMKTEIDARARVLAFGEPKASPDPEQDKLREKGDIARFSEELAKMSENGKLKDPAATDKYIKDFIATRGLTEFGASTTPRDEWTLEDDPNLRPLVQAHRIGVMFAKATRAHGPAEPYFPFGRSFFWKVDERTGRPAPATGTFLAEPYPPRDRFSAMTDGRTHYVVWRTQDTPAKKTNRETARPAVIAAWKLLQARKLAEARANELAEKIRAFANTDPLYIESELRDLHSQLVGDFKNQKAKDRARDFRIANVAPVSAGPQGLQRFDLPDSEDIPYPTFEMTTALLENRDKAPKTVLVLPDAPKDTFYVATLLSRKLKPPSEFAEDVYSMRPRYGQIVGLYQNEAVKKARESVLELLKKEFKYEETEDQKKKLDENAKTGGRNFDN